MTPEEFIKKVSERSRSLQVANIIYPAATATRDKMTRRLFDDGKMGNGNDIGRYSTDPMYASKRQFKKTGSFRPQGKYSTKPKFKNGNPRRSMYFKDGYKGLRGAQGYRTDKVNITYTADLRNDFATKLQIEGGDVVLRLSRVNNQKKAKGLREKYGASLWKHTEEERQFFATESRKATIKALS